MPLDLMETHIMDTRKKAKVVVFEWSWYLLPSPGYQLPYQDILSFVEATVTLFSPHIWQNQTVTENGVPPSGNTCMVVGQSVAGHTPMVRSCQCTVSVFHRSETSSFVSGFTWTPERPIYLACVVFLLDSVCSVPHSESVSLPLCFSCCVFTYVPIVASPL